MGTTYLKTLSSSMTWMPCSYSSRLALSPTEAKWLFIMSEGAEGCLMLLGRPLPLTWGDEAMMQADQQTSEQRTMPW